MGRLSGQVAMALLAASGGALGLAVRSEASDPISVLGNTQGVTWSRGGATDLALWFRGVNDLVFLGRFESWQHDTSAWHEGDLVRCRIDSIITGYSSDSVVAFSRLTRPSFAAERLRTGTPVLARLSRRCTITGANCGDFMVIADDGSLLSDHISSEQMAEKERDPRPLRVQDIPLDVLCDGDIGAVLRASAGVACAYLTENHLLPSAGGVWRCSDATWVIPSADSLPTYVRFPRKESCYTDGPPVRYLIPVPGGFRGDTLFLDCCPRVLRVKGGVATALGVTLPEFREVVGRAEDGRLQLVEPKWIREGQRRKDEH